MLTPKETVYPKTVSLVRFDSNLLFNIALRGLIHLGCILVDLVP